MKCLSGLYDPVLDDSEYIYVPFDPDDLDQEFNIEQQRDIQLGSEELIDKSKSTTEFTICTSSETVEKPIILKLNYKDVFPEINVEELPPDIKYRLPISEQYDPEGKRVTMFHEYNKHSSDNFEILKKYLAKEHEKFIQNKALTTDNGISDRTELKKVKFGTSECIYFQKSKGENDLSQIEKPAPYVEENNFDSSANKINKEMDIGLQEISILKEKTSKMYEQSIQTEQSHKEQFYGKKILTETQNSIKENDKSYKTETLSLDELQKEVSVAEEIKKFETLDMQMDSKTDTKERKLLRRQDVEEAIEAGTVRQRTEMFKKDTGNRKLLENKTFKKVQCDESTSNVKLSQQRVYKLGLEIIPRIRKAILLSQHGNCLFKRFVMHLTKVMITLSRFVLFEFQGVKEYAYITDSSYEDFISDSLKDRDKIIKKEKLSGAKIAQIEGLKPAELTNKMDMVISEFLRKSGIEENYYEKKLSRSNSRSRSNSKSNIEEIISNEFSFKPKTMTNEKKTLQETYETKKSSMEIREIKSEKRYSEMRSSKMDSKVNFCENEIKPVDDGNIIYIAIVEAHVYTNKDAIFGEQLREMSKNSFESDALDLGKVYYRCEVSVTYRDFRESSLAPTVIIESIEEIPSEQVIEEEKQELPQTSALGFEEMAKKLAVQKITEFLEPLLTIKEVKSVNIKHAYPAIEMPLKTITETTTLAMEKEKNIFQESLLPEKSHASIEKPVQSVVETSILSIEEDESGSVDILKFIKQKPQSNIEKTEKSIAETTEIIEEEKVGIIDCTQQVLQKPHPVIESSTRSIAEVTKVITEETKSNILNILQPISVMPHYTMSNNLQSVAETITTTEEANTDILNISKSMSITPRCAISNNLLSIAETFTTTTEEPQHENPELTKISGKAISVGLNKNFATEIVEIFSEEPIPEEIVRHEIKERHGDEFLEKSLLMLPKTSTVSTEEAISERLRVSEPLSKELKININVKDIPVCAEVIEITLNEKEQNTFHVFSGLQIEPLELKEKPVLSVVETATVLPFEPKEEPLKVDKIKTQDAQMTIEESKASEITVIHSEEPKEENLKIYKVNNKRPNVNMESSVMSVAEKLSISLQDPNQENLEIPNLDIKSSQKLFQDTGLIVAESLIIRPTSPESVDFTVSDKINERAKIKVEESKATITSEVHLNEPKEENLELPVVNENQPRVSVQDCTLSIVTKLEILPEGPKDDNLTPFLYEKDVGDSEIEEFRAILATVTLCEEPKFEYLEIPEITEKQYATLLETPLSVAETLLVVPEPCFDSFDIEITDEKATINFVEIQNHETFEIRTEEPREKHFEISIVNPQSLQTRMEELNLLTAESLLITPEIFISTLDARKTENLQANTDIVEQKGIETILVCPWETYYENLELPAVVNKKTTTLIEKPVLVVAQTLTVVPEGPCNDTFTTEITEKKATVNIVSIENRVTTETTAEEPTVNILEIPIIHHQRLQTYVQKVHLSSAESSITIPETYFDTFDTKKIDSQKAHIHVVEQKGIESILVCPWEPNYDELEISTVHKNQPDALIETPVLTVAEMTTVVTAEPCKDIFETKITDKKATVNILTLQNRETTETIVEEPKEKHLDISIINQQNLQTNIEKVHLSTAESSIIIPEMSVNTFDPIKTESQQANVGTLEQIGIETLSVCPWEPNYENLGTTTVNKKQPETLIEKPVFVAAETVTVVPEGPCNDIFTTEITKEKATVNIVLTENRETTETTAEEPSEKYLEIPVINHQRLQTDVQKVHLLSAEASIILPETHVNTFDIRKLDNQQAHIDIVEQKGIESILVYPWEPSCEELEISAVFKNLSGALIETPVLTVAEILIVVTAESYSDSFETKIMGEKATVNVVVVQIGETTETTPEGPKEKHLEIPIVNVQSLQTSQQEVYLSTAESSIIIPNIAVSSFDARKTESQKVHIDMVEQIGIQSILVYPWEPNCDDILISKVIKNDVFTFIETPILIVAETLIVVPEVYCDDEFETKVSNERASINIVASQNCIITETSTEEPKENDLEITVVNYQRSQTYIEGVNLSTAETSFVIPEIFVHIYDVQKIKSQNVHVHVIEQKGIETHLQHAWETNYTDLEIFEVTSALPKTSIESPVLILVETSTIVPEGPHYDNFETKVIYGQATLNVVAILIPKTSKVTVEEPKEKNLEIPIIDKFYLKVEIEDKYLSVAEMSLIIPYLSVHVFDERKPEIENQNSLTDFVKHNAIAIFFIVSWEPNYEELEVQEIIKKIPQTLTASSVLAVAENLIFVFEEKVDESLKTIKTTAYQPTVNFIESKVAVNLVVFAEEPMQPIFERPELFFTLPQLSVVDKYLIVAEILTILPLEPKEKIFDITEITSQQAHLEIEECRAAVLNITVIEEYNIEDFIIKGLITKESENLVEITVKMIAQVTETNTCDKEFEFLAPAQAIVKKINVTFEAFKPVAQKLLIFTEETKQELYEYSKFTSYQAMTKVIKSAATAVAESITTTVATHQSQKSIKAMEQKHEMDITEIVDISGDIESIESTDITKYSVELAKDNEDSFLKQRQEVKSAKDDDFVTLSSVSTSSSISSAPSSPLIEEFVFGVKGHEYKVHSPQETSLEITTAHVDTGYKIENIDTSMTIVIEAAIEKLQGIHIQEEEIFDFDVKKREFWISDVEIKASMESTDVNMNIMKSKMNLEREYDVYNRSKHLSFQDLDTSSALITKNRSLSYDQAAEFEVNLQSLALESKESDTSILDSQEVATFEFRSGASFESSKDIQSTEANVNIKTKSAKRMTAESIDVVYGLTIENEIMDYDHPMDLSVEISNTSTTAEKNKRRVKKAASNQTSIETSKSSLSETKLGLSTKESYSNQEAEIEAVYGSRSISTSRKSKQDISQTSFSGIEENLGSNRVSQATYSTEMYSAMRGNLESNSISLANSTGSIEMDARGVLHQTGLIDETQISRSTQSPSSTAPSTPLTDYYIFRLQSPYPEETTFVPRDCSFTPESVEEDSLVIINGLIPHIDTKIERILYSPPLQTPDTSPERQTELVFTKSEMKGSAQGQKFTEEEIRDIGRKSSLLASEIDRTIRSIEEYKESVGMSTKEGEEIRKKDNVDLQNVESSVYASQEDLSIAEADESFKAAFETKVKGLNRRKVIHKKLAISNLGEQSVEETDDVKNKSSISKSSSSKSSNSKISGTQSSSSIISDTKSSSSKISGSRSSSSKINGSELSSSKLLGSQSNSSKISGSQSSSRQISGSQLSSSQISGSQSSSSKISGSQSSSRQISGSQSSSSQIIGSQSSSSKISGSQTSSSKINDSQLSSSKISGSQSSSSQISASQTSSSKISDSQSSGSKISGSQSSGSKISGSQSSGSKIIDSQSSSSKSSSSKSDKKLHLLTRFS